MFISERLQKAARLYHREARKCLRGKAFLAACIMQAAALEGLLQAMCFLYPGEIRKTTAYQRKAKRGFRRKRNKALDFNYSELINIAAELSWFPPERMVVWGRRTNLAGFVHELRGLRNYVHPGVLAPKDRPVKFTKGVFNVVFEIFEVANNWLLHRVETSIRERMEHGGALRGRYLPTTPRDLSGSGGDQHTVTAFDNLSGRAALVAGDVTVC